MAYGSYNQYDSRWGSKNYNGSSTMSGGGCGPTSCANILHNVDPSITPLTTMKYMQTHGDKDHKKFAIYGQGTAWNGITQCLKYYGAKEVKTPDVSNSMTKVWDVLKKGHVAIFLMRYRKGLKGPTWTTSGHYIAIVGYKYKDKKHYVKVEDCGGRGHDGWYCYETQMRGWIHRAWTCLALPKEVKKVAKPTGTYSGTIPAPTIKEGSKGTAVKNLQLFLNWYGNFGLVADGVFGPKTAEALMIFQNTEGLVYDAVYGAKSQAAAKKYLPKVEPKPDVTAKTNAEKLLDAVEVMAWPLGTDEKKWAFKTGSPTENCKKVMTKYGYKGNSQFSDCGFAQNSIIRLALGIKVRVLPKSTKTKLPDTMEGFNLVWKGKKVHDKVLKPGMIVDYKKVGGSQHTYMFIKRAGYDDKGNPVDIIAEAGRDTRFLVIRKIKRKCNNSNVKHSTIHVWEAK